MATASALKASRCSEGAVVTRDVACDVLGRGAMRTPAERSVVLGKFWGGWAQMQKTHAARSLGKLLRGCFEAWSETGELRLEQGDTGATARHVTTHATGGGGEDLLHQD